MLTTKIKPLIYAFFSKLEGRTFENLQMMIPIILKTSTSRKRFLQILEITVYSLDSRINGLLVGVCDGGNCENCGAFLNGAVGWNYLACDRELLGSQLVLKLEQDYMNFCEILIHRNQMK